MPESFKHNEVVSPSAENHKGGFSETCVSNFGEGQTVLNQSQNSVFLSQLDELLKPELHGDPAKDLARQVHFPAPMLVEGNVQLLVIEEAAGAAARVTQHRVNGNLR